MLSKSLNGFANTFKVNLSAFTKSTKNSLQVSPEHQSPLLFFCFACAVFDNLEVKSKKTNAKFRIYVIDYTLWTYIVF
jgi:hypothetical protein